MLHLNGPDATKTPGCNPQNTSGVSSRPAAFIPAKLYALLRRVAPLRSAVYLYYALKKAVLDTSDRRRVNLENMYSATTDPWNYTCTLEQSRYDGCLAMLRQTGKKQFDRVAEIGCGEGFFTVRIAPVCKSLLALDCCSIALQRAQTRCAAFRNLTFQEFNLRSDYLEGQFDLILAMDVLDYFARPWLLARLRTMLVRALSPGGFLLVTTAHQGAREDMIWSSWLPCGRQINEYFGRHPDLHIVSGFRTEMHNGTLHRKRNS